MNQLPSALEREGPEVLATFAELIVDEHLRQQGLERPSDEDDEGFGDADWLEASLR